MLYKPMDYQKPDGTPCYKNGSTTPIPCSEGEKRENDIPAEDILGDLGKE